MKVYKLLISKVFLCFLIIVLLIICCLLSLAIYRDAEISFSKNCWLKITPRGTEKIKELQEKLSNLAEKYQSLNGDYQEIEKMMGINRKDGKEAVSLVRLMCERTKEIERDTNYSFSVIRYEVLRGRTINTKSLAIDQTITDLYKHIQKFFTSLGIYNGKIDGNPSVTCEIVKQFQRENGVDVDGIIGEKTLKMMEIAFEKAKSH